MYRLGLAVSYQATFVSEVHILKIDNSFGCKEVAVTRNPEHPSLKRSFSGGSKEKRE